MTELVSREAFMKAIHLDWLKLGAAARPLMRLSGISRFNELYDELHLLEGLAFIDAFMNRMKINIVVEGKGLDRIPKEGAFVAIANHPYGLWDGLVMLKLLAATRSDFRIMANVLLQQIPQIRDCIFAVNPVDSQEQAFSQYTGLKHAVKHLEAGSPLGIFPAAEVSSFHRKDRGITDKAWAKPAIKLMAKAKVPVIPIYFEGANSALYQLMSLILPGLRLAAIPSETLRMKEHTIRVRIGSPITVKEQKKLGSVDRLGRYLRARVYSLGTDLEVQPFFRNRLSFPSRHRDIAAPSCAALIVREIERMRQAGGLVCAQGEFDVFIGRAGEMPHLLQEIGRRREITFRQVGEGAGLEKDLDEFDLYYRHLILWDREAQELVGAYRMGLGDEIMQKYGKRGFYTFSLFKMKKGFFHVLETSVELGRSFVVPEYQRKRLPLFLLWKGIRQFLLKHPQYHYLIGPVSISNDYSSASKTFMVEFIRNYFFDHDMARQVKPRKRFKPGLGKVDYQGLLDGTHADLKMADRMVDELEPCHAKLPVLLKKYIKQNARIIGFNVDPKFMNSLDGFIMLDISMLPQEAEEMYG